ncbi:MAG: type IV pilin protein [Gemmatimonadota bacterium]
MGATTYGRETAARPRGGKLTGERAACTTRDGRAHRFGIRRPHGRARGFTLIEIMVVVVLIAVVAAIALPMYGDHVVRGKLSEATGNLADLRTQAEQFYNDNRTYVGFGCATPAGARYFTYSCSAAATTYTITASGVASQGTGGFTYTINQSNTRTTTAVPSGWGGAGSSCWVTRKAGTC